MRKHGTVMILNTIDGIERCVKNSHSKKSTFRPALKSQLLDMEHLWPTILVRLKHEWDKLKSQQQTHIPKMKTSLSNQLIPLIP